jgi:gag-polypeptide of LTR copia-type
MSSNASKHLASLEKFDGTNWEDWAYSVRSTFRLTHILRIAEGKEKHPIPASPTAPTEAETRAIDDWDRRNDEGLGLIQLTIKPTVRQTIKENETLAENWKRLEATYGTRTGLNLWVDITKYVTTSFSPELPLTQQIDEMSELRSRIESAQMPIADSLHAMLLLHALPSTYEIVQQTILASVSDYKAITSANMRSRILSEELRQGTTTAINAIRSGKKASNTCNFCGAPGHWERECRRKKRGLSKEEAQSEWRKWGANNAKEKETAKDPPSVSTTIQEVSNIASPSTTNVSVASTSIESLIFYITCDTKWMLDLGCSDHITYDVSDFSEYR